MKCRCSGVPYLIICIYRSNRHCTFICIFTLCRCLKFTVNDHCIEYNLATNDYIYQYTSVMNMTQFSSVIRQVVPLLDIQGIPFNCQVALNLFLCNFGFPPCNLTTGTPKPICSKSCFYFHQNCPLQFELMHTISGFFGFSFVEDCFNTLGHLEQWYDIEISSDDFGDDCLDFGLESEYLILS